MKNICIAAIGTRGDVRPMLALADAFDGNNQITFIVPPDHIRLCEEHRYACHAVGDDFSKVAGSGSIACFRRQIGEQFKAHHAVYGQADVIVGGGLFYAGRTLAEYFGKPYYHLFYTPQVLRSDRYAPAGVKKPFRGKWHNRLLWLKSMGESDMLLKALINRERNALGLQTIGSVYRYFIDRPGTIIAADDGIAGMPSEYDPYIRQINTLTYKDGGMPSEALHAFLDKGSTPLLISFGSAEYVAGKFSDLLQNTVDAVVGLGYRAVVISETLVERHSSHTDVFRCAYAPHAALFPKVRAIIHHGGTGTVFAALKAGTPQIIVPQALDQFYWAEILEQKRLGKAVYSGTGQFAAAIGKALGSLENEQEIHQNIRETSRWMNSAQYREESLRKLRAALPACFAKEDI